jgi:hypothetical protein
MTTHGRDGFSIWTAESIGDRVIRTEKCRIKE